MFINLLELLKAFYKKQQEIANLKHSRLKEYCRYLNFVLLDLSFKKNHQEFQVTIFLLFLSIISISFLFALKEQYLNSILLHTNHGQLNWPKLHHQKSSIFKVLFDSNFLIQAPPGLAEDVHSIYQYISEPSPGRRKN